MIVDISDHQNYKNKINKNKRSLRNTYLTLSLLSVPPEVGPAPTLALIAPHREVGVADEVHVQGQAGRGVGAVLEWLEAGRSWCWLLINWVANTLKRQMMSREKR